MQSHLEITAVSSNMMKNGSDVFKDMDPNIYLGTGSTPFSPKIWKYRLKKFILIKPLHNFTYHTSPMFKT